MIQLLVRWRRILGALGAGLIMAGAIAPSMTSKPPKLHVDRKSFQAQKAPAIPFEPFVLRDATGQPIDPTSTIKIVQGVKMSAGEYLTTLNDLEKMLNAHGQTLRKPGSKTKTIADVVTKERLSRELPTNSANLRRQVAAKQ